MAPKTTDQPDDATPKARPTAPVRALERTEVEATVGLDETIAGGKTIRSDGTWQNANGLDIDVDGTILDTPDNRERNARRFSGVPL